MPTHYKPKKINNITAKDSKIAVIGKVVETRKNSFILDDDTGKIEVFSDEAIEKDKLVRVFCSVIEEKVKTDIVQSLEGLDLNLFKKCEELYNKVL